MDKVADRAAMDDRVEKRTADETSDFLRRFRECGGGCGGILLAGVQGIPARVGIAKRKPEAIPAGIDGGAEKVVDKAERFVI